MDTDLLNFFINYGVWALLSGILIFYIIKKQEQLDARQDTRDSQYQNVINSLSESLRDVKEIKEMLKKKVKQV